MFRCELCDSGGPSITFMGFAVVDYCKECYENRRTEVNANYNEVSNRCVESESKCPYVDPPDVMVTESVLSEAIASRDLTAIDAVFKLLVQEVLRVKLTKLGCSRNWQMPEAELLEKAIPFCFDRLQVFDPARQNSLEYFIAVIDSVYCKAKLENSYDWAY